MCVWRWATTTSYYGNFTKVERSIALRGEFAELLSGKLNDEQTRIIE